MDQILLLFLGVFWLFIKSHFIISIVIIISFLLEKLLGLKLLIWNFKWEKNIKNQIITSQGCTVFYMLINLGFFIYSIIMWHFPFDLNTISIWIIIMFPLVSIFHRMFDKYQGKNSNKGDQHFF